jgi:hypothetical protein
LCILTVVYGIQEKQLKWSAKFLYQDKADAIFRKKHIDNSLFLKKMPVVCLFGYCIDLPCCYQTCINTVNNM